MICKVYTFPLAGRRLIEAVVSNLESIVSDLPCATNFRPAISAARDGAIAGADLVKTYLYLLGAAHASRISEFDEDVWDAIDAELDRLLAAA